MLVSTCKRGEAARGKSVWSFCSTRMAGLGGQSYYNNTLKIKANGGRWVEGGKSLVETTGSLTQTGVLPNQVVPTQWFRELSQQVTCRLPVGSTP